jgi:hypothetical protein
MSLRVSRRLDQIESVEKGRMIVKWGGFSIRHHHRQD